MKKTVNNRLPNYLTKILQLKADGQLDLRAGLYTLEVRHDDTCQALKGGPCDCDPDLVLVTPNFQQPQDPKGTATK